MGTLIDESASRYKRKILVVGYIGGINVGDEAIAAIVARRLKNDYDFDVTIASGDIDASKAYIGSQFKFIKANYPGTALSIVEWARLILQIKDCDGVFFAGGGLLQDVHSTNLMQHCVFYSSIAKIFNKEVVALGIGAGPIKTDYGHKLARYFFECSTRIIFRDDYSIGYMKELVPSVKDKSQVGFDSILLTDEVGTLPVQINACTRVGLCLRPWDGLDLDAIIYLASKLLEKYQELLFLAYEDADIEIFEVLLKNFPNQVVLSDETSLIKTFETIRNLDSLVSMRLHANLFAVLEGVNFVALAYDKKLETVLGILGFHDRVLPLKTPVEEILIRLDKTYSTSTINLETIKIQQKNNLELLVSILEKKATKFSVGRKINYIMFWFLMLLVRPFFREFFIWISPVVSKVFTKKLKAKVKNILGINW